MNIFSAHKFQNKDNLGFSPEDYSRFKYGSKSIARKFGKHLANEFIKSRLFHNLVQENKKIVVCSSPYDNIPTATFAMKDYFIAELNLKLVEFEKDPVQECKVYRTRSYNDDYGAMNKEDRTKAISGDDFYIDSNFINGKHVLFLDDIRITGAHEERMQQMIDRLPKSCSFEYIFMYYAELISKETCPTLENHLNLYAIKSLLSIDHIIKNDKFTFNTRAVKYILNAPIDEFTNFCNYQSIIFRDTLLKYSIANSYHTIPEFKEKIEKLRELLK